MANGVCYVYWIHLPDQTDMFTTGYIGFTGTTVEKRFASHKNLAARGYKKTSCAKLYNALNKYGIENFIVDTICICDKEYGLWLENKLRPTEEIGLNIAVGGSAPMLGRKRTRKKKKKGAAAKRGVSLSKEHCENISRGRKGIVIKDESRKKISDSLKGRKVPPETLLKRSGSIRLFKNPFALPCIWEMAESVFTAWEETGFGGKRLGRLFNTTEQRLASMINAFKSGWNPSEDLEYLAWREAYLAEQRKDSNDT